jgi:hypothetical protein
LIFVIALDEKHIFLKRLTDRNTGNIFKLEHKMCLSIILQKEELYVKRGELISLQYGYMILQWAQDSMNQYLWVSGVYHWLIRLRLIILW